MSETEPPVAVYAIEGVIGFTSEDVPPPEFWAAIDEALAAADLPASVVEWRLSAPVDVMDIVRRARLDESGQWVNEFGDPVE